MKSYKLNGLIDHNNEYWYAEEDRNCEYRRFHREDGPAIIYSMGFAGRKDVEKQWWYLGKRLDCKTQEEFESLMRLKAFW
jgi:hypothetical protein